MFMKFVVKFLLVKGQQMAISLSFTVDNHNLIDLKNRIILSND